MKGCVSMEDLIFLMIAIMIGIIYNTMMRESEMQHDGFHIENYNVSNTVTADVIKNRLIGVYNSDVIDKREKIVSLLIQLEKLEDTDNFFMKYDHIRSYIFNST